MLELHYHRNNQLVQVVLRANESAWADVRSAFQDSAEEIITIDAESLTLPVWAFLSCRRSLQYTLRKHRLSLKVDDDLRHILAKAGEREQSYTQAVSREPIDVGTLTEKLRLEGFKRSLTAEQTRNVLRLAALPSAATFSVPGAGKTTEALAYFSFRSELGDRLLVVCPKNAFAAWEEQIAECFVNPPEVVRLVGGSAAVRSKLSSTAKVFLVTYQQLHTARRIVAEFLAQNSIYMLLDESHHIKKGSEGQWGSSVLNMAHLPKGKLIMTGTPIPNSVSDLVPQFNFIYPEVDVDETSVSRVIQPVFVRTTKIELGLPEVKRFFTAVPLPREQRALYELLRSETLRQLVGLSLRDRSQLRQAGRSVMRLLQATSNPALLIKDEIGIPRELQAVLDEEDSAKLQFACLRARHLAKEGVKTIIWSTFVGTVETIARRLRDLGADFIHGGVEAGSEEEADTRENKIKRFHDNGRAFVLVANPAACSEGISLHKVCHHAIYVDRNYNAAQYLQPQDRVHRIGISPSTVTSIEILYSPDTIDESVTRRLNVKILQMSQVLNDHSIGLEPEAPDLDSDGLQPEDIADLINHLRGAQ